jgi:hypothetical protein
MFRRTSDFSTWPFPWGCDTIRGMLIDPAGRLHRCVGGQRHGPPQVALATRRPTWAASSEVVSKWVFDK